MNKYQFQYDKIYIIIRKSYLPPDASVLYNGEKDPACVAILFDVDPETGENTLQWREQDCNRAKNVMCEIDFRNGDTCHFGTSDDPELTKITTDPFGIDPDRCMDWQRCNQGM